MRTEKGISPNLLQQFMVPTDLSAHQPPLRETTQDVLVDAARSRVDAGNSAGVHVDLNFAAAEDMPVDPALLAEIAAIAKETAAGPPHQFCEQFRGIVDALRSLGVM